MGSKGPISKAEQRREVKDDRLRREEKAKREAALRKLTRSWFSWSC